MDSGSSNLCCDPLISELCQVGKKDLSIQLSLDSNTGGASKHLQLNDTFLSTQKQTFELMDKKIIAILGSKSLLI